MILFVINTNYIKEFKLYVRVKTDNWKGALMENGLKYEHRVRVFLVSRFSTGPSPGPSSVLVSKYAFFRYCFLHSLETWYHNWTFVCHASFSEKHLLTTKFVQHEVKMDVFKLHEEPKHKVSKWCKYAGSIEVICYIQIIFDIRHPSSIQNKKTYTLKISKFLFISFFIPNL